MLLKILVACCVSTLLVWTIWFSPVDQVSAPTASTTIAAAKQLSLSINQKDLPDAQFNELPKKLMNSSLKGTIIDGLYPVDENGNLIIASSIKHRFEYFLSTMGEFSFDEVKQMVIDDIHLNLSEPARSQALTLFTDYIGYKYALADLENSLDAPQDYELKDIERMRFQLQQLRDKRREYFDQTTIDAFFGFDETYDDFMLARLEIQSNQQLTETEKQDQITSLENSLPETIRAMREETQKVSTVFKLKQEMKAEGATEDEIYQLNAQEFGEEAAQRLQTVARQREAWENKVTAYIKNKQSIIGNEALTDTEKQNRIEALIKQFDENEQRRLGAYELMMNKEHN